MVDSALYNDSGYLTPEEDEETGSSGSLSRRRHPGTHAVDMTGVPLPPPPSQQQQRPALPPPPPPPPKVTTDSRGIHVESHVGRLWNWVGRRAFAAYEFFLLDVLGFLRGERFDNVDSAAQKAHHERMRKLRNYVAGGSLGMGIFLLGYLALRSGGEPSPPPRLIRLSSDLDVLEAMEPYRYATVEEFRREAPACTPGIMGDGLRDDSGEMIVLVKNATHEMRLPRWVAIHLLDHHLRQEGSVAHREGYLCFTQLMGRGEHPAWTLPCLCRVTTSSYVGHDPLTLRDPVGDPEEITEAGQKKAMIRETVGYIQELVDHPVKRPVPFQLTVRMGPSGILKEVIHDPADIVKVQNAMKFMRGRGY
jgi:hypothetical protein